MTMDLLDINIRQEITTTNDRSGNSRKLMVFYNEAGIVKFIVQYSTANWQKAIKPNDHIDLNNVITVMPITVSVGEYTNILKMYKGCIRKVF